MTLKTLPATKKTYLSSAVLLIFAVLALITLWDDSFNLAGALSVVDIAPRGFEYEEKEGISRSEALNLLQEMQQLIEKMEGKNYSVSYVRDALREADISYKEGNYIHVLKIYQLILFVEIKKDEFRDKVSLFSQKQEEAQQQDLAINESRQFLQQAVNAFRNDQLDESFAFLEQAELALQKANEEHSRVRKLVKLGHGFFQRNWWKVMIIVTLTAALSRPLFKMIRKKKLKSKLAKLQQEAQKITKLLRQLQKECFVDKKILFSSYKTKTARYQERLSEIKYTIPVVEAQLRGKTIKARKKKPKGVLEITSFQEEGKNSQKWKTRK